MWSEYGVPVADRICGNCKYWDSDFINVMRIYEGTKFVSAADLAPCMLSATDPDNYIMKGFNSRQCENEADAEPCEVYLEDCKQAAANEETKNSLHYYLKSQGNIAARTW